MRIPHITVADDLAVLSNSRNEMQHMLDDTGEFANMERYIIHPTKSGVLTYSNGKKSKSCNGFTMFGKTLKAEQHSTHLGIFRDVKKKINIEEKVTLSRKTAYALMGAGLHSGNGLTKQLCAYLWNTYVIPRLVYGLEVQQLTRTDIEVLEKFQRKCLRQIQGLPDKTPNCVTLSLIGVPPVETIVHKNMLNLFVSSARSQNSVEYEVLERQLVMKDSTENSWCNEVKRILEIYDLPSAYELFVNPPSKYEWKAILNSKLNCFVETAWKNDIRDKSSLKYLNPQSVSVGSSHSCWSSVRDNVHDSKRAELKVKILTGSYILQANRSCFNQYAIDPTCKLCKKEPEDREHFIARCWSLEHIRCSYRQKLVHILNDSSLSVMSDSALFTQITLDWSVVVQEYCVKDVDSDKIELWSREMISKLHYARLRLLNKLRD